MDRVIGDRWEKKSIQSELEWKEFIGKTVIVESAHDGMKPSIPVRETFINFKFIRERFNWMDAQRNCEILGVSCSSNWTEVPNNWIPSMSKCQVDATGSEFGKRPQG